MQGDDRGTDTGCSVEKGVQQPTLAPTHPHPAASPTPAKDDEAGMTCIDLPTHTDRHTETEEKGG